MHQQTIHFLFTTSNSSFTSSSFHPKSGFHSPHCEFASLSRPRNVHFPIFSLNATLCLPLKLPHTSEVPTISPPIRPVPHQPNLRRSQFREKMLYLESIGLDFVSLINHNPPIVSASLSDIKSTVDYMTSLGFTAIEFRRIAGMCPEIITSRVSDIVPVFTFLLREVCVNGSDLKRVINRRPRLLACSVKQRLRPTLYFLQSIGISEANKHTYLLSTSVEEKLIPRIEYFENIGFSHRDAVSMFRRFPQLFNYSVEGNFEPKFNYFVVEMGRDLRELKEFPHYFSFSLENRIKPRHQCCVEKGVCFPLPVLLKMSEAQFRDRVEVCHYSSLPLRTSPLWCTNYDIHFECIE
ncbi:hypothetical protein I3842_10G015700 [Carya illinoinensis]|uniref:Transcription termination factor MTEF1, chloroplastic n=1 Tax=Carya illinoinensis TaxID=32201 RepID=A0A922DUW2_CARIL|nr:hypothetical protein I3842_10G015700 [Carya illinoinensis]